MASVDFMKLHTIQEVRAQVKHDDIEERQHHEHSNKHIQKALTPENYQYNRSYNETVQVVKSRLEELDKQPSANHRPGRVIAFYLCVPIPAGIPDDKRAEYAEEAIGCIEDQYGEPNIINAYLHNDEIHDYLDSETGELRTSLPHIHVLVMPVINGKLNGKKFSSASNMRKLNKSIDSMSRTKYGVSFLTGTGKKSRYEVEELKQMSERRQLEADRKEYEHEVVALNAHATKVNEDIDAFNAYKEHYTKKLAKEQDRLNQERKELEEERTRICKIRNQYEGHILAAKGIIKALRDVQNQMNEREAKEYEKQRNALRTIDNLFISAPELNSIDTVNNDDSFNPDTIHKTKKNPSN